MWVTKQMYLGQPDTEAKLRSGLTLDPNNKMPEAALLFWNSPNAKNPGHVRIFSCPKYTMLPDSPCLIVLCICFFLGLECLSTSIPSAPSIRLGGISHFLHLLHSEATQACYCHCADPTIIPLFPRFFPTRFCASHGYTVHPLMECIYSLHSLYVKWVDNVW